MWVCSRLTRAGSTPGAASAANASAKCGVQPRSSRVRRKVYSRDSQLQPAAEHFGNAPRLRDAAARQEGRLGVEHFADLADAGFVQVPIEPGQQIAQPLPIRSGQLQLRV